MQGLGRGIQQVPSIPKTGRPESTNMHHRRLLPDSSVVSPYNHRWVLVFKFSHTCRIHPLSITHVVPHSLEITLSAVINCHSQLLQRIHELPWKPPATLAVMACEWLRSSYAWGRCQRACHVSAELLVLALLIRPLLSLP
jgi:hypothetical protein